jgi:hypothetical protein
MLEFVESLNAEQFKKIEEFFENLPKLKENVDLSPVVSVDITTR